MVRSTTIIAREAPAAARGCDRLSSPVAARPKLLDLRSEKAEMEPESAAKAGSAPDR